MSRSIPTASAYRINTRLLTAVEADSYDETLLSCRLTTFQLGQAAIQLKGGYEAPDFVALNALAAHVADGLIVVQ